jgi:hypothetical protein
MGTLDHEASVAETTAKRNQQVWAFNPHILRTPPISRLPGFSNGLLSERSNRQAQRPAATFDGYSFFKFRLGKRKRTLCERNEFSRHSGHLFSERDF